MHPVGHAHADQEIAQGEPGAVQGVAGLGGLQVLEVVAREFPAVGACADQDGAALPAPLVEGGAIGGLALGAAVLAEGDPPAEPDAGVATMATDAGKAVIHGVDLRSRPSSRRNAENPMSTPDDAAPWRRTSAGVSGTCEWAILGSNQ